MTTEEIIQGNKMIAEFDMLSMLKGGFYSIAGKLRTSEQLEYHSSWDWQIPSWSKIAHLTQKLASEDMQFVPNHLSFADRYESAIFTNDTQKGFEVICDAIQCYNDNLKNQQP